MNANDLREAAERARGEIPVDIYIKLHNAATELESMHSTLEEKCAVIAHNAQWIQQKNRINDELSAALAAREKELAEARSQLDIALARS